MSTDMWESWNMSRIVEFRNRIHHHFQREWLSPSQNQAYIRLKDLLMYQDIINLYGSSGSGKTFLTWILVKEISISVCYLGRSIQKTDRIVTSSMIAIADPHSQERSAIRETLTRLRSLGYEKIILVSDEPTTDQIPTCQLMLTSRDLHKIQRNWESIAIPVHEIRESDINLNLHAALRQIALRSLNLGGE